VDAIWAIGPPPLVGAKEEPSARDARDKVNAQLARATRQLLLSFYAMPPQIARHTAQLRADLRRWQQAVGALESASPSPATGDRSPAAPLRHIAAATTDELLAQVNRVRRVSVVAAALLPVSAIGWVFAVEQAPGPVRAAVVAVMVVAALTLLVYVRTGFGRRSGLAVTVVALPLVLLVPAGIGLFSSDEAVRWWSLVLLLIGMLLAVWSVAWFVSYPRVSVRPARVHSLAAFALSVPPARLRDPGDERLAGNAQTEETAFRNGKESLPRISEDQELARTEKNGLRAQGDLPTLSALLDELEEEIAFSEEARSRAWRTWQVVAVALSSAAALASGAAGVLFAQNPPNDNLWPAWVAAAAAALSGVVAALNPGRRQEDNRLTMLGCQALRRELRVLRDHDVRHDPVIAAHVRDALEDMTVRFEAVLGGPEQQSYWRRRNAESADAGPTDQAGGQ
jgi:hypothetical protein